MKRKMSVFLAVALFLCISLPVQASDIVTMDASDQLEQYSVSLSNVKSGTMRVTFSVFGTGYMAKIGAQRIVVEQQVATNVWQEVTTFGGQYAYDSLYKGGNLDFSVLPNVIYRAKLTAYAKDYDGYSDTGTVTSGSLRAN